MDNRIVRLIDMPTTSGGFTLIDEEGDYNIYINARFGYYGQRLSCKHEDRHINDEDFNKEDVAAIERSAHGL